MVNEMEYQLVKTKNNKGKTLNPQPITWLDDSDLDLIIECLDLKESEKEDYSHQNEILEKIKAVRNAVSKLK